MPRLPIPSALRRIIPHRQDLRTLLRLALPVVVVQVGMKAMGVVDTLMVGRELRAVLADVFLSNF